jgi:hypothetical protein
MDIIGRVQNCGCIALPPEVQEQTRLFPSATFRIELTRDKRVVLIPLETKSGTEQTPGAACG